MSRWPVPTKIASLFATQQQPASLGPTAIGGHPKIGWAGLDSWLFLRSGGTGSGADGERSTVFGGSQAGAVARFRLAASPRSPEAHVRLTHAPVRAGESELAAGVSVRPWAHLPLRTHAEGRLMHVGGRTELRPAAFVTAGADNIRLPAGLEGRGYAQAGWVGGRFATGFADGQAVVDREVARFDLGVARAGAGAWAGVQKGIHRIDIGPSASVALRAGASPVRLSVDYRIRVDGEAEPARGAAVTLSRSF